MLDEALPVFAKLRDDQIHEILALVTSHHFDIGDTVFEEHTPTMRFFLLLDDTIRVMRVTPEGEQVIVTYFPSGEMLGLGKALGHGCIPQALLPLHRCCDCRGRRCCGMSLSPSTRFRYADL